MRRVLIVSPHFPPTNAPDMHRARHAVRHLPAMGWTADVLAVDPRDVSAPSEPRFDAVPRDGGEVHAIRAPLTPLARLLRLSSVGRRAAQAMRAAGDRILSARPYDLVFFSTSQHRVLTLGPEWRACHGVPYVVDWQDPWVTDYYDRPGSPPPPGGWKYRVAARAARQLEGPCLQGAGGVVSVNTALLRQLEERHAWMQEKPRVVIPFGAEPQDFSRARAADVIPGFVRRPGTRHLVYVGAAGAIMRPALELLFASVRDWLSDGGARERLRLHFIGTSYAPAALQSPTVLPLAATAGLADLVEEQPSRIGHFAAVRTLLEADGCLILGSDNAAYSPSKIASVALARRPVLAIVAGGSELEKGLRELGLGRLARFSPTVEKGPIVDFLNSFAAPAPSAEELPRLTATERTRQLANFFETVLSPR